MVNAAKMMMMGGGGPLELAYSTQNNAEGSRATIPSVAAGDLLVAVELSQDVSTPAISTPAGWTSIFFTTGVAGGGNTGALAAACKIADGTETGAVGLTNITSPNGSMVLVFSGGAAALGSMVDTGAQITFGSPTSQIVNASTLGTLPMLVLGAYGCATAVGARTFTGDTAGGEESTATGHLYVKYLFYAADASPADITIDKGDDGDNNGLGSAIIEVS